MTRSGASAGRGATALARAFIFAMAPASTLVATFSMATVMGGVPTDVLGWVLLFLFTSSFLWLAFAFWSGILGFVVMIFGLEGRGLRSPQSPLVGPPLFARTAILMPVRNENAARTIGSIEAMDEALARLGVGDHFHFFILSDTNRPDIWVEEELGWARLVARRAAGGRIFYRRRPRNTARKSGNIADFCQRWGAGYDYMIVLDADSLMAGESLLALVRMMDANPDAGLIQAPTIPQGRSTLLGRLIQYASTAYGAMFTRGLAYWLGDEGTYWGHNAIMRTDVFAANCGLPRLQGRAPFGGEILSHDIVEAALIRRAGYRVYMATALAGSYEEAPANVIEYAKRDRRWCQGNLQHLPLLASKGFHPINRLQLLLGISAYLIAPFWFLYIVMSLAFAAFEQWRGIDYFTQAHSLTPNWPIDMSAGALALLASVLIMLFLPRVLALLLLALDPVARRRHGGVRGLGASALVETVFSTAFAPLLMIFQTRAVVETLTGLDSGWPETSREEGTVQWRAAFAAHSLHMIAGAALIALSLQWAPDLFAWLLPVALPLLLAPALAVLSGSVAAGRALRRAGILLTPEETETPPLLARAVTLTRAAESEGLNGRDPIAAVTVEPANHAVHRLLLRNTPLDHNPDPDALTIARVKLGLSPGVQAGAPLNERETMAVLLDLDSLDSLFARTLMGSPEPRTPSVA